MTVSSLGGIGGVTFFTPIINPPEVSILGVGKSYDKVVSIEGQITTRKILPISLSYDHRIIDGAEAARFSVHLSQSLGKDFAFKLAVWSNLQYVPFVNKYFFSLSCAVLTSILWGSAFVAQDMGMDFIGPHTFNVGRFFIGFLILLPFFFFSEYKKIKKKNSFDKKAFFI